MTNFEKPEVRGWFVPRVVPPGGAPEEIRKQWVGVPLPLRYDRPAEGPDSDAGHDVLDYSKITIYEDCAKINVVDAVRALRIFGRNEGAEWWEDNYYHPDAKLLFEVEPGHNNIFSHDFMCRIMPGIEEFDVVEI